MQRVKASSLLETIVAMVVLLTVFSISLVIIKNVLSVATIGTKTNSYFMLQEEFYETIKNKKYFDEDIDKEQFKISRQVSKSTLSDSLLVIEFKAIDTKGVVLSSIKETILKDE
jgi:hypothetical protein